MLQSEYWISELAALSGVSTRTIRYYIQEGLLPQPEIRGKYAVFTDQYMHRLRLIKYLKDVYLPLNRIKKLLDSLTESQLISLLKAFEADPVSALSTLQTLPVYTQESAKTQPPEAMKPNNALNYINRVRGNRSDREGIIIAEESTPRINKQVLQRILPPQAEEWQRFELVPGVELHVRQPVKPRTQFLIDRLIELAKDHKIISRED